MSRAVESHQLRGELARWRRERDPGDLWQLFMADGAIPIEPGDAAGALDRARSVWVSEDMALLVEFAASTLDHAKVRPSDPPWEEGFALFGARVALHEPPELAMPSADEDLDGYLRPYNADRYSAGFDAISWSWGTVDDVFVLSVTPYIRKRRINIDGDIYDYLPGAPILPGPTFAFPVDEDPSSHPARDLLRGVRAFWLLCQQRVAQVGRDRGDRPAQRRAARAGLPAPDVSVVTLRSPTRPPAEDRGTRSVEWSKRWLVSGHWRNQWLPSEGRHEPRWISPYVKGPDDKPLAATAYRLVR